MDERFIFPSGLLGYLATGTPRLGLLGGFCTAVEEEGRPVTLVESVTLTVLLSVVVSLMSEKVQSWARSEERL